jgi:hypothetical protein
MLRRIAFSACSVALLAGVMATSSSAQTFDKRTLFTFSDPVSMPGITLPAGQYLFRLANPDSGRNVVQVLSADGTKPFGMFFSMRAERYEPASTPEVRFMETAAGMPAAIRTWWYPGERTGYEFVYPKDQARQLAQRARQPVLTTQTQSTTTEQTNIADLTRLSSAGQQTNINADAAPTASTPGGSSQTGEVASSNLSLANATIPVRLDVSPSPATTPRAQSTRASLPQTASLLPAAASVGGLALCAAAALWASRRTRV